MKPYVFVGSSSEGLSVAYSIQENIEDIADVAVWNQDLFRPSEYILESLLREVGRADSGILVFTPDDITSIRGVEQAAVRDNVIFELGLFVGNIGRARSFVVAPRGDSARLLPDLLGLNLLEYESNRGDGNLTAALGPACYKIQKSLADVEPRVPLPELELPIFERRDLLTGKQRYILSVLEAKQSPMRDDFQDALEGTANAELHYRMEQLRLMSDGVRRFG